MPKFWNDPKFRQKYGQSTPPPPPAAPPSEERRVASPWQLVAGGSAAPPLPAAPPSAIQTGAAAQPIPTAAPNGKQGRAPNVMPAGPVSYGALSQLGQRDKPTAYVRGVSGQYEPVDLYRPDPAKQNLWDRGLSVLNNALMWGSEAGEAVVGAQTRRSTNPLLNFSATLLPFLGSVTRYVTATAVGLYTQTAASPEYLESWKRKVVSEQQPGWEATAAEIDQSINRVQANRAADIGAWQKAQSDLERTWKELWSPSAPKIEGQTDERGVWPTRSITFDEARAENVRSDQLYAEASALRAQAYSILRDVRGAMNPAADPQAEFERVTSEARNLIAEAQRRDVEGSHWYDPTWSWSLNVNPQRRQMFEAALTEAEMQVGRPLENWEITRIKEHFVDPWEELSGQIVGDFTNLVPIEAMIDLFKIVKKPVAAALAAAGKSDAAMALVTRMSKAPVVGPVVQTAQDLMGWATRQAVSSSANRLRREIFDVLERIAKTTDVTTGPEHSFQAMVETIVLNLGDPSALRAILPASLGEREINVLTKAVGVIEPDEWGKLIDNAYNDTLKVVYERAITSGFSKDLAQRMAEEAASSPANVVEGIADSFQTAYRRAHVLPGSSLAQDSALVELARALNVIPAPATAERLTELAEAGDKVAERTLISMQNSERVLKEITNWTDRIGRWWTGLVLSARPGWSLRNMMDSYGRYLLNGGNLFDGLGNIMVTDFAKAAEEHPFIISALADTFARSELEAEQGVARRLISGWSPEAGPLSYMAWEWDRLHPSQQSLLDRMGGMLQFGADLLDGSIGADDLLKAVQGGLKDAPLNARRGLGEIGALASAWSNGWHDFNASIEFATRMRMYHTLASRLYPTLEREALPLVMEYVQHRPLAQQILTHLWDEAGHDPAKFRKLYDNFLENASSKGRIDWSFLVPPNLAAFMSPSDREMFLRPITRGLEELRAANAGVLPADKINAFFDDVSRQIRATVVEITQRREQDAASAAASTEAEAAAASVRTAVTSGRTQPERSFLDSVQRLWPKPLQSKQGLLRDFSNALTSGLVADVVRVPGAEIKILRDEAGTAVLQIGTETGKLRTPELRGQMFDAVAEALYQSEKESLDAAFGGPTAFRASLERFLNDTELLSRDNPERFKRLAQLFDRNPQLSGMVQAINGRPANWMQFLQDGDLPVDAFSRVERQIGPVRAKYGPLVDAAGKRQAAATGALARRIAAGVDPTLTAAQREFANSEIYILDRMQEVLSRFWLEGWPAPLRKTGREADRAWDIIKNMRVKMYDAGAGFMRDVNHYLTKDVSEGISVIEFMRRHGMDITFKRNGQVHSIGFSGELLGNGMPRMYQGKRSINDFMRLIEKWNPPAHLKPEEWMNMPIRDWMFKSAMAEATEAVPVAEAARVVETMAQQAADVRAIAPRKYVDLSKLPEYVRDDIERYFGMAEKAGLVDEIERLSAERLNASQIAHRLESRLGLTDKVNAPIDARNVVRSVRAKLGIPSMDDRTEFAAWIAEYQARGASAASSARTSPDISRALRQLTDAEIDTRINETLSMVDLPEGSERDQFVATLRQALSEERVPDLTPNIPTPPAARGAPAVPVFHVRLGITPSTDRISYISNVHQKALELANQARAGVDGAEQAMSELLSSFTDWALEDFKGWIGDIEGVSFHAQPGMGAFFGDIEPTIPVELRVPLDKADSLLGRLAAYADTYKQSNFHVRMQLNRQQVKEMGFALGQRLDDGSVIEPLVVLNFKRPLTLQEIEGIYGSVGLPGMSITHDGRTLTVYNVSLAQGADHAQQFADKIAGLIRKLSDEFRDVLEYGRQGAVRLWNYGEAAYGGTRSYADVIGGLSTDSLIEVTKIRAERDPIARVITALQEDDLARLALNDEIDNLLAEIRSVPEDRPFWEGLTEINPQWGLIPQTPRSQLVQALVDLTLGKPVETSLARQLQSLTAERLAYGYKAGERFVSPSNPYVVRLLGMDEATAKLADQAWAQAYGTADVTAYLRRLQDSYRDANLDAMWRAWSQTPRYNGRSIADLWGPEATASLDLFLAHLRDYRDRLAAEFGLQRVQDIADSLRLLEQEAVNFRNAGARAAGLPQEVFARVADLRQAYPVSIPYWKLPEDTRTWLWRAQETAAQASAAEHAIATWRDYLLNDMPELFNTPLDFEDLAALKAARDPATSAKYDLLNTTIYGGEWMGRNVAGALPETQRTMLDYQDFNNFDETMRALFPFWLFPSRSLPFWVEYMVTHPALPAFYEKYLRFSRSEAIQNGAITTSGSPLPSLKGYVRIPGSQVWVNPTAALSFRYVIPQAPDQYQTDAESDVTPTQQIYAWLNDIGQTYGFSLSPWIVGAAQIAGWQDVSQIPSYSIVPQLDLVPPWAQREILQRLRQTAFPNMPDTWSPEISWKDYLIEKELLSQTLQRMQSPGMTDEQRYDIALSAKKALLDREASQAWLKARQAVEESSYYTTVAGYFTGVFGKEFSDADAELLRMRNDLNALRDSVNSEVQAGLFKLSPDESDRYDLYVSNRYETPQGYLASLYSNIRYVRTPEGDPALGDERRDLIAQRIHEDELTSAYYEKLRLIGQERDAALARVPVGASGELRQKIWDDYATARAALDMDPNFAAARRGWVAGYIKPQEMVDQHYLDAFMFAVRDTRPRYDPATMDYATWQQKVAEWEQNFPAAEMLPAFQKETMYALGQAIRNATSTSDRAAAENTLTRARIAFETLAKASSYEQFRQWEIARDTPIDALNEAWRALYWNPYWSAQEGLSGNAAELARRDFYLQHPQPPTPEELVAWVNANYPANQFNPQELYRTAINAPVQDIEERLAPADDKSRLMSMAYDILAWAGPGKAKAAFIDAYAQAGGNREDITIIYETGGAWTDPNKLAEVVQRMSAVADQMGLSSPSSDVLAQWVVAQQLNDKFRADVTAKLGDDIFTVISNYGSSTSSEKRDLKQRDPRIQRYYDLRDQFGEIYPEWSRWYMEPAGAAFGGGSRGGSSAPWWEQLYGAAAPTTAGSSATTVAPTSTSSAAAGTAAPNPYATAPQVSVAGIEQWRGLATSYGQQYNVPPEFVLALILAESGGNASAIGDGGHSVGLFQLHDQGVGSGMTVEQRQDPHVQFKAMMPRIAAAYQQGLAKGLAGADLAIYVGAQAERPAAGAERRYGVTYMQIMGGGSASVGSAPMPAGNEPPGVALLNRVLTDAAAKGITPIFNSASEVYDFADYILNREMPGVLETWNRFKSITTLKGYDAGQAYWNQHPELQVFDEFRQELVKRYNAAQKGATDPSFAKALTGSGVLRGGSGSQSTKIVNGLRVTSSRVTPDTFLPLGFRSTLDSRDLLNLSRVGQGGVGGKPVWPRALYDKWGEPPARLVETLGTTVISAISKSVEANQPIPPATQDFLKGVAERHPEWSGLIAQMGVTGIAPASEAAGAGEYRVYLPTFINEPPQKPARRGGGGSRKK